MPTLTVTTYRPNSQPAPRVNRLQQMRETLRRYVAVEFRQFSDPGVLFTVYTSHRSATFRVTRYGLRIALPAPAAPAWVKTPSPWTRIL